MNLNTSLFFFGNNAQLCYEYFNSENQSNKIETVSPVCVYVRVCAYACVRALAYTHVCFQRISISVLFCSLSGNHVLFYKVSIIYLHAKEQICIQSLQYFCSYCNL